MNNNFKIALAFSAGVIGGVLGTKKYFEEKYKKIADDEIEKAIDDLYSEELVEEECDIFENSLDETEPTNNEDFEFKTQDKPDISEVLEQVNTTEEFEKAMFEETTDQYKSDAEEQHNIFDDSQLHPEDDIPDEPYRITYEEYAEDHLEYDKIDLVFYVNDGFLVDNEDKVVDLSGSIGAGAYDDLMYGDESELFYRNDRFGEDYEVVRIRSSYVDEDPDDY